jgi:hypothetical protein
VKRPGYASRLAHRGASGYDVSPLEILARFLIRPPGVTTSFRSYVTVASGSGCNLVCAERVLVLGGAGPLSRQVRPREEGKCKGITAYRGALDRRWA